MMILEAAALELAAPGLPVFPCHDREGHEVDKTPYTPHGWKNATTDPERIRRWWWGHRLIGVPTGAISGFVVLDVDPRHGGDEWAAANRDKLPFTRTHKTRSGGWHLLYRHPGEHVANSAGVIADGIDVRGDGGYIIWWPAHGYAVDDDVSLVQLAIWSDWISHFSAFSRLAAPRINFFRSASPRLRHHGVEALRQAVETVAAAPHGERNATLNKETWKLGQYIDHGALTAEEIADALATAATVAGLDESEIRRTLASALTAKLQEERI